MFRASCANASATGFGQGKQSRANLYATQHALRYVGAYALIHEYENDSSNKDSKILKVFVFGSTTGFCVGSLLWNNETHHVEPLWRGEALDKIEVFAGKDFAPWEVGYVGAQTEKGDQKLQDMRLTLTTRPIPWRFQEPNVPPEVCE